MNEIKVGSYTGTGAAINIELGFVPDYVEVWNETDGDISWKWRTGMTAAHALQDQDVVDSGTTGNHSMSRITSNGITAYSGDSTPGSEKRKGFTIGTALSESGKTFGYVAFRNAD